jgi:DNA-binding HxlR family transcriptional regulator
MDKKEYQEPYSIKEKCLKHEACPMVLVQSLLAGKRKILILWYLSDKILRFNEIKKKLSDVTQKMLTKQLRSLEEDHLIFRHVYPVIPPKVEYGLTEIGREIIPILEMMHGFGEVYLKHEQHDANRNIANDLDEAVRKTI